MYQWLNHASGRLQMSGEPPSWYRSGRDGPRVMVFDRGFLVDDTAIDVSILRRLSLRKAAFDHLDESRAAADLRRLKEAEDRQLRVTARAAAQARQLEAQSLPTVKTKQQAAPAQAEALPDALNADGIARLKAIISAFDKLR